MRNTVSWLTGVFLLVVLVAGCATTGVESAGIGAQDLETRRYEVYGMDCPACHGGLTKLVNRLPAVDHSKANWEIDRLTVYVKAGAELEDEAVFDAVRRANFTPGERVD